MARVDIDGCQAIEKLRADGFVAIVHGGLQVCLNPTPGAAGMLRDVAGSLQVERNIPRPRVDRASSRPR
jgi:hypothetical protein